MKTIKITMVFFALFLLQINLFAQVGISTNGSVPAPSAMLDVSSTSKGFLMPRMSTASRNAIVSPANGLLIYNTQTDEINYFNGANWQNLASASGNFWSLTGTSIYNNNTGNVGIGDASPTNAKFVVNGGVNNQVALFKSISGVSIYGGSNPNIGLNIDEGKAIDTGNGLKLGLNSIGFDLDYFPSKNSGVAFTGGSDVIKFQDLRSSGLGQWLYLMWGQDSRLLIPDIAKSQSNGNLNLVPIGVINFKVTNLDAGANATKTVQNVGNNNGLFQNIYHFNVETGAGVFNDFGYMNLVLNLDFITKGYEDIYIVGSPNFYNTDNNTQSSFAKFYRNPIGTSDRIQIWYGATFLGGSTEVFGTLMVYGTKIN